MWLIVLLGKVLINMGGLCFLKGREEKVDRRERGGWGEVLGGEEEGRGN